MIPDQAARPSLDHTDWVRAMRAGDYSRAWALAAQTLAARGAATRDDPALPYHLRWVWDGTPVDGRDVLVRCYHGLGDVIQFARYLPLLGRRARSVILEAPPRLVPLLAEMAGVDRLVSFDVAAPLPPAECDLEIMDLPFALRAEPAAACIPYLHAPRAPLPAGTIGLCYQAGGWDPARSVPPGLLTAIAADHPCLSLVSEASELPVLNPAGCPFDVPATASLVAGCALVITVDTMVAHLAGALGRPTWLLLRQDPDWRWPDRGTHTPWYPTMRLFHQPRPGDWLAVVAAVQRQLDAGAAEIRQEAAR